MSGVLHNLCIEIPYPLILENVEIGNLANVILWYCVGETISGLNCSWKVIDMISLETVKGPCSDTATWYVICSIQLLCQYQRTIFFNQAWTNLSLSITCKYLYLVLQEIYHIIFVFLTKFGKLMAESDMHSLESIEFVQHCLCVGPA